eukprot:5823015-Amphidinium_carterae.1
MSVLMDETKALCKKCQSFSVAFDAGRLGKPPKDLNTAWLYVHEAERCFLLPPVVLFECNNTTPHENENPNRPPPGTRQSRPKICLDPRI